MLTAVPSIDKLRWIMAQLRDPDAGCPWDLKQKLRFNCALHARRSLRSC